MFLMFLASPSIQSRLQLLLRRASPLSAVATSLSRGYSRSPPDLESSAAQSLAAATAQHSFWDSVQSWMTRVGRKTTLGASTALFSVCQRHIEHGYWQRHAHIGDDFRSTHMLLVLHVWMVHKRLLTEGKRGLLVQESRSLTGEALLTAAVACQQHSGTKARRQATRAACRQ
eukprot:gene13342-9551_t